MFVRTLFLFLVFFISAGFNNTITYSGAEIFPVHEEMKPAVRFWIDVYAKYSTNQHIVHDSRHMDVIYEIVTLEAGENPGAPLSRRQKNLLKDKSKKYKEILRAIAAAWPDTTKLNDEQRTWRRKLHQFKSAADFRNASRHVRIQKGQKNKFKRGLEISGRYMTYLKKIFKLYNLPEELTVLPHVESSFNYRAYSSAGAAGIWQFTRGTGKRFLKISYEIDERLDPLLATEAAARLLSANYRELGHWPLAITAYNHGLSGMKRAVRKHGTDMNVIIQNYRSRYFKFASRNFYTEFIAALHVVQHYQDYFGTILFESPIQYKELELPRYLKYSTLERYLDLDKELFQTFNPALRPSVFNNSKYIPKGYRLRLPVHISADSLLASIPQAEFLAQQKRSEYYRIRYGDTLSEIARRFGTSVELLLALNNLDNAHIIRRGMTIRLPDANDKLPRLIIKHDPDDGLVNPLMLAQADESTLPAPFWKQPVPDIIEPDTISAEIAAADYTNLKDSSDLEIEFIRQENPAIGYIRVEPEETLGHYAEWLQVKTQKVRNWNNLPFGESIQLNRKIKLVFDTISATEFNRMRLEYHRGIEEDFFMNYEISGTLEHQVKSGENIWYLCNYTYNLPFWLIVDYNKDVNFAALKVGDKLIIPEVKARNL